MSAEGSYECSIGPGCGAEGPVFGERWNAAAREWIEWRGAGKLECARASPTDTSPHKPPDKKDGVPGASGTAGVRFYKANVEAGKTYYFYAHTIEGVWGLEPVRSTMSEDLAGWDKATTLTVNSPKNIAWAEENKVSVAEKRALKPEDIVDANTLRTEDGR